MSTIYFALYYFIYTLYTIFLIKFLTNSDNLWHFSFFSWWNLILLVTDGRMRNFKTLAQSLLGEFRWGSFFFFFLLPRESKVNSLVSPGVVDWQKFLEYNKENNFHHAGIRMKKFFILIIVMLNYYWVYKCIYHIQVYPLLDKANHYCIAANWFGMLGSMLTLHWYCLKSFIW